jgi:uncharacterized membrane protein
MSASDGHGHSHGHGHGHGQDLPPASAPVRRALAVAVGLAALVTLVAVVLLWPRGYVAPSPPTAPGVDTRNVEATVVGVSSAPCDGPGSCTTVQAAVEDGPDAGQTITLPPMQATSTSPALELGDRIVLQRIAIPGQGKAVYNFQDHQRAAPLWWLALTFALVVVAIARWRGLAALIGLAITWAVFVSFVIPAVLAGTSPLAVSLAGSALIVFVVLYLVHGVNARTSTALLGTLASLALTGVLAVVAVSLAHLTGLASDESTYLQATGISLDVSGLLLAGIVIGTLGVLTDITVTQAAVVWEVRAANPALHARELMRSGMRTGRDHIASTVYTLVLAYAGATLPLLVLFSLTDQHFTDVITSELVAEELARSLLGSLGLVASVPLTTALAAFVAVRSRAAPSTAVPAPEVPDLWPPDPVRGTT